LEAEKRLCRFIVEIIIPLAERTNAIIFLDAIKSHCMLSSAFSDALDITRAKYEPISVICAVYPVLVSLLHLLSQIRGSIATIHCDWCQRQSYGFVPQSAHTSYFRKL